MTNDELLARIDERQKSMVAQHQAMSIQLNEKLDSIIKQTTLTNGRVSKIEDERLPKLEHWKSRITGIWFTVGVLATVFAFIMGWLIEFGK